MTTPHLQNRRSLNKSAAAALYLMIGVAIGIAVTRVLGGQDPGRTSQARRIAVLEDRLAQAEAQIESARWSALAEVADRDQPPVVEAKTKRPAPALQAASRRAAEPGFREWIRRFGTGEGALDRGALTALLRLKQQGFFDYAELVALLRAEDPQLRRGALNLLRFGDAASADPTSLAAARGALLAILEDPAATPDDRRTALSLLPLDGEDQEARVKLQRAAEEGGDLGRLAIERLGAMPGERDFLAELARGNQGATRRAAIGAMLNPKSSDLDDPQQQALILSLARDPDPALRVELFQQLKYTRLMAPQPFDAELMGALAGVYAEERSEEALTALYDTLSFNARPENVAILERRAADPSVSEERRERLSSLAHQASKARNRSSATRIFDTFDAMMKEAREQGLDEERDAATERQSGGR